MPVIKSAIKKLRQDKKREKANKRWENLLKSAVKKAKKNPSQSSLKLAVSLTDKASKKNIIHKNKAARLKSQLARLIKHGKKSSPEKPISNKTPKRPKAKK
ncbi:30S ribosomal protein S20 [Patescibacteria group bacterium]|nr:30S ribosomal protein S20 [Patescibacteria group bacterium]MCL5010048.1 30S ribosomal protein S20 [Patescibacteria group bacterium]